MEDQVLRAGAQFLSWHGGVTGELRDWGRQSPLSIARGTVDHMIAGPARNQARDTTQALCSVPAEQVVTSFFALGAMIAAEARQIPFDVLMPNVYALQAKGMPPMGTGMKPARGALGLLRDRLVGAATAHMIDRYALERINALRLDYELAPIATTWEQVRRARRQLILTSEAFDFPAELPDSARDVGPILDDPVWASDKPWTPPAGDAPLVLVAMSSTFQNQAACLQRVADALGTLPVRGLVTVGPAIAPEAIRAPANVSVMASAPHREVLSQARLVVTHGGHGTVIKALAAGLPLVILHHGRDQADNAVRVTERGAGAAVSRRASAATIAKAITAILGTPEYRQAAEQLGGVVAQDAANNTLLTELED